MTSRLASLIAIASLAAEGAQVKGTVVLDYFADEAAQRAKKPYLSEPPHGWPTATVQVTVGGKVRRAEANIETGAFELDLPPGSHAAIVECPLYGIAPQEHLLVVEVATKVLAPIRLALIVPDGPAILGWVWISYFGAGETGGPAAHPGGGVQVAATEKATSKQVAVALTDASGRFRLAVPQGEYQLHVTFQGVSTTVGVNVFRDKPQIPGLLGLTLPKPVSFDTGIAARIFVATRGSGLTKRMAIRPAAGRAVEVRGPRSTKVAVVTDAAGMFALAVPAGDYELAIEGFARVSKVVVETGKIARLNLNIGDAD